MYNWMTLLALIEHLSFCTWVYLFIEPNVNFNVKFFMLIKCSASTIWSSY